MNEETKRRVVRRLSRTAGQVRGLQHMIDDDRDAIEILTLISAVRAALDAVGTAIIVGHVSEALVSAPPGEVPRERVAEVQRGLRQFIGGTFK